MTRINTNVSSLNAQKTLARSNAQLQESLTRLSTGLRINSGKDDPAGLIASETLRSDIVSTQVAIKNSERANQMIATADSALGQVSSLLNDVRGLVSEAANTGAMSSEQIAANQLQVDSSLEAIDRIAQVTQFQGKRLLDGSLDFITEDVDAADITALQIDQANFGTQSSIAVTVTGVTEAEKAELTFTGTETGGDVVLEIGGSNGYETFNFAAGSTIEEIAAAVNLVSDSLGVTATANTGVDLDFTSTEYGSDAFVSVKALSGTFDVTDPDAATVTRDTGADIDVRINGIQAVSSGLAVSLNTSALDLSFTLDAAFTTDQVSSFTITDGGAQFQMGPDVVSTQQARMGIQSINTSKLGGASGQLYQLRSGGDSSLSEDTATAGRIVEEAITSVTTLRGRLGAFQSTTLQTNIDVLNDTLEGLTEAESSIRDADFAAESAKLTRAQILVQSGISVLSMANQNPQNVLSLLR